MDRSLDTSAREAHKVADGLVDIRHPAVPLRRTERDALPARVAIDLNQTAIILVAMQNDVRAHGGWFDTLSVKCVFGTLRDANFCGYDTITIEDATALLPRRRVTMLPSTRSGSASALRRRRTTGRQL